MRKIAYIGSTCLTFENVLILNNLNNFYFLSSLERDVDFHFKITCFRMIIGICSPSQVEEGKLE